MGEDDDEGDVNGDGAILRMRVMVMASMSMP